MDKETIKLLISPEAIQAITVGIFLIIIIFTLKKIVSSEDRNFEITLQKIIGGLSVFIIAVISQNTYVFLLSLFIGGLIIASEDFMKVFAAILRSDPEKIHEIINADIGRKKPSEVQPSKEGIEARASDAGKVIDEKDNEKTKLQIELDFERIYNFIFGSQIFLLREIKSRNGVGWDYVSDYFDSLRREYSVFNSWNLNTYLEFLKTHSLIEMKDNFITVSQKGETFISYIDYMNYQKYGL
ncbi:MAG: hypothetical protein Q7S53_03580 [bacterium]|nr:hypothetical protein [bacterium]